MASVSPSEDYGPALRASCVWAALTSSMAIALALPIVLAGPSLLVWSLRMPVSVAEMAGALLLSSLGGLILYGVLRCVVLSTASVWRSLAASFMATRAAAISTSRRG